MRTMDNGSERLHLSMVTDPILGEVSQRSSTFLCPRDGDGSQQ
jgi:hypothetical protein